MIYCDASRQELGCVLIQEGKANVVVDALSRKSRLLKSVLCGIRATLLSPNVEFELKAKGAIVKQGRLFVLSISELKDVILEEAHSFTYVVHPGSTKIDQEDSLTLCQCHNGSGSTLLWIFYLGYLILLVDMMIHGIVSQYGILVFIVSDRDPRLTFKFWPSLQKAFGTKLKFSAAFHPQTNDKQQRDLEFKVGDQVFLKFSLWKGVIHFGRKGKLSPRYIGPYKITE
ncbi:retrotransposon protein, putative, Ty3-gypsy sub-class [Cucumis melo var. makuwa]|uniref:Retrotransposon protein, putative, Ty3-gypsy sub-class n=1 Tax=Cucumis melo var. makuwa TaxID=1194695 RepID=A0A5D3CSG9_CUCMM|nr:retrotransposon protein, putative, Ty3-gypsy sub-class [Cucumis melo var. makuwa]